MDDSGGGILIFVLLFWLGLAIVVGVLANSKGRSGGMWFFLALAISPLLAGLFLLASKDLNTEREKTDEIADSKVCPRCAERVKRAAKVCRFCGHEFGQTGQPVAPRPVSNILDPYALAAQSGDILRAKLSELSREQLNRVVSECGMDPRGYAPRWKREDVVSHIVTSAVKAVQQG